MSNKSNTIITDFDQGFSLIRNAQVIVEHLKNTKNKDIAKIWVGDGDNMTSHIFKADSGVSQALQLGVENVADQLRNGTFFFHGNDLVSYRGASYNGFVHTDDSINQLIEHIGYTTQFAKSMYHSNSTDKIRLMNQYSKVEMQIEQYQSGGEMDSRLSFAWDPFQAHIKAVFQLVRLVCANGMTGLADFMNAKIPVVSDWIEHMEIANKQIQNKVTSMVNNRMGLMAGERASVRDCLRISDACHTRLNDMAIHQSPSAVDRIRKIALVADPRLHLKGHYPSRVFDDRRLSDQAASHLTAFTAWNMITELASHTGEVTGNSNTALHKHANELLIDRGASKMKTISNVGVKQSQVEVKFDDLDAAFAGDLIAQS